MVERQPRHGPVVVVDSRARDDGVDVGADAPVGQHDALRCCGRAAGELQDGEPLGIVGRAHHRVGTEPRAFGDERVEQHDRCVASRRCAGRRVEERCQIGIDDHEAGVGVGDPTAGLLDELLDRAQPHREGKRDDRAAGEERRLDGRDQGPGAAPEDADVDAGADPAGLEGGGDPARVVVEARPLDPVDGSARRVRGACRRPHERDGGGPVGGGLEARNDRGHHASDSHRASRVTRG